MAKAQLKENLNPFDIAREQFNIAADLIDLEPARGTYKSETPVNSLGAGQDGQWNDKGFRGFSRPA